MKLTPLKSSNVESAGFDPATGTLVVKYKSGGTYRYSGCKQSHYDDLCKAESAGKFLNKHIKGAYDFKRDEDEKAI